MVRAIIGVGNVLMSDEGVGVHAVRRLEESGPPEGVLVFDGGTEGYGLMDVLTGIDRLVLIDCVKGGQAPGTLYRFDPRDVAVSRDRYQASIHQAGILEILQTAALVGKDPVTTVIGVEPETLEIGMELSPTLRGLLPRIVELAVKAVGEAR